LPFDTYTTLSVINIQEGDIEVQLMDFYEQPISGACFNGYQMSYSEDYSIYTVTEANFDDLNNPVESQINAESSYQYNYVLDVPFQGLSVLDFDFVKSSCIDNLLMAENGSTSYQIYPIQQSSKAIVTEQTSDPVSWDVIVANQTLNFKSDHITLQPGFHVLDNACFNAVIEPCQ